MTYTRFAIYYLPPEGAWADFGASWLGWDVETGAQAAHPDVPAVEEVTATPRKYGFHATLKPPFRLAQGCTAVHLDTAVSQLANRTAPAQSDSLSLTTLGRFLALTLDGDTTGIERIASACVAELDSFRAPLDASELARRRKARLSEKQEALLERWGYPFVMDAFRFHMTLTGKLPKGEIERWKQDLGDLLPPLPAPFRLDQIALVAERADGNFEVLRRYPLTGSTATHS